MPVAIALLLLLIALDTWATRRVLASDLEPWRKRLLIAGVWVVPLMGAWIAHDHVKVRSAEGGAGHMASLPADFVSDEAPAALPSHAGGSPFELAAHGVAADGFVLLDWGALDAWAASAGDPAAQREAVASGRRAWLLHLRDALGSHFHLHESADAWVLSSLEPVVASATARYIAATRRRVQGVLPEVAQLGDGERSVLLVLDDEDDYYRYVSLYEPPDSELPFSSGVFIHAGCPHFVARRSALAAIEPVIAHELTHSAVAHLDLPLWLNEGLAVNTEQRLTGVPVHALGEPQQRHRQHQAFWGAEEIQQFWSGESFRRTDEGTALSYDLARILVEQMARNWGAFAHFVRQARRADAGAQAAREAMAIDLGGYVGALLEAAPAPHWAPDPSRWPNAVGEAARLGGLSVRRVRFHADEGLPPPAARGRRAAC